MFQWEMRGARRRVGRWCMIRIVCGDNWRMFFFFVGGKGKESCIILYCGVLRKKVLVTEGRYG